MVKIYTCNLHILFLEARATRRSGDHGAHRPSAQDDVEAALPISRETVWEELDPMDHTVRAAARSISRATHKTVPTVSRIFDSSNVHSLIGRHSRMSTITGCHIPKHRILVSSIACLEANVSTIDIRPRLLMARDATSIRMTFASMDSVRWN